MATRFIGCLLVMTWLVGLLLSSIASAQSVRIPEVKLAILEATPLEATSDPEGLRSLLKYRQEQAKAELGHRWSQYRIRDGELILLFGAIDRVFQSRLPYLKGEDDVRQWHEARFEMLKLIEKAEEQRVERLTKAGNVTISEFADVAYARFTRATAELEIKRLKGEK